MKIHRILFAILLGISLFGCGTSSLIHGPFEGSVKLDTTFRFYTREVYAPAAPSDSGKTLTLQSTRSEKDRKDLREVQFLLLSKDRTIVIYMAMAPDIRGKKYLNFDSETLSLTDINKIYFGRAVRNTTGIFDKFKFFSKDGYSSKVWELSLKGDSITIDRIQTWWGAYDNTYLLSGSDSDEDPQEFFESEINVREALYESVVFKRTTIEKIKDGKTEPFNIPAESFLKFSSDNGTKVSASVGSGDKVWETFGNKRIEYTPLCLPQAKMKK